MCNASSQVYDAGVLCVKTSVQARCAMCQARQCRMVVCKADVHQVRCVKQVCCVSSQVYNAGVLCTKPGG